jgi:Holliday junction resolvase RusA-like endonuclease
MIAFQIPGDPVAKGRPRFVRATGRAFTPQKTLNYEAVVKQYAADAMRGRKPFEGPLRVTIRATFLVPKSWSQKKKREAYWKTSKPDADNIAKLCKDAMNKIVWTDDAIVAELCVQKRYGPVASLAVSVEVLEQREAA